MRKLLFFIAAILILIACSKSDQFLGGDFPGNNLKNGKNEQLPLKYESGTTFNLTGVALFDTWKVTDGTVLQDAHNECTAELIFLEKNNFKITFYEVKPDFGTVPFECYGNMASSGILTFKYPTPVFGPYNITDIIKMNSCATIWGPSVNEGTLLFKGKFDGTRFTDEAKFMARVNEPCPEGILYLFEPINSNLHWTFGHDLNVINK